MKGAAISIRCLRLQKHQHVVTVHPRGDDRRLRTSRADQEGLLTAALILSGVGVIGDN